MTIRALCLAAALLLAPPAASASPVDGTWRVEDLVLDLYDCQAFVCGRIVWIGDPPPDAPAPAPKAIY